MKWHRLIDWALTAACLLVALWALDACRFEIAVLAVLGLATGYATLTNDHRHGGAWYDGTNWHGR